MPWIIVRHWAELALVLEVVTMFQDCHSLGDVIQIIREASDINRLGVVTALAIAASSLGELLNTLAHAMHMPGLLQWMVSRLRGNS